MTRENPQHLDWIRSLDCAVCGRKGSEPHHWRTATNAGVALRPDDEMTIPLCFAHHRGHEGIHQGRLSKKEWTHLHFPDSQSWEDHPDDYMLIRQILPLLQRRVRGLWEEMINIRADLTTAEIEMKRRADDIP